MMKNVRSFVFLLALGTGSLAVGCGGSVEQPQTQASAVQKAPVAAQSHGVVKVFGDALGDVALRPEQRTEIEQLAATTDARHATMADGRKDLMLAIADQVEKGSIDRAALQPKIDRIVADLEKSRPDDRAALTRLHAILDADQRNAFVDALESRFKAQHQGWHGHGDHGAKGDHAAATEQGQPTEKLEGAPAAHGGMGGIFAMRQLSEDLKLTDDQRSQIKDAFKAARSAQGGSHPLLEMHQRMGEGKKALESFRGDTFDANAVGPTPDDVRTRAAAHATHAVTLAEKVLPVLTPEQRKIAAEKVRGMAAAGAEMPFAH